MEKIILKTNEKNILTISKELIKGIKMETDYTPILEDLKSIKYSQLLSTLDNDNKKKTFWINIYNSLIQLSLHDPKQAKLYPKSEFFAIKAFKIDHFELSFDDIEHKILRKSQIKYLRGYLSRCCVPRWEKELRLTNRDYRIHFALNCGAKSCPPVLAYDEEKMEDQLKLSKRSFVLNDSIYDEQNHTLSVSKIFYWFLGDFGGTKGIVNIHKELGVIPQDVKVNKLIYKEYDWKVVKH